MKYNLAKNVHMLFLINKFNKNNLDYKFFTNQNQLRDKLQVPYIKLPCIGKLWIHIKSFRNLQRVWQRKFKL